MKKLFDRHSPLKRDWRNEHMSQLKLSDDCILEKSTKIIVNQLLNGEYVIVADLKPEFLLKNVLHWNKRKKALAVAR
jgi:hypothetical protein